MGKPMSCHLLTKTLVVVLCVPFTSVFAAMEPSPEESAVRAVLDAQVTSWNKADIDGFMAGYWKDEKLTFISGGDITCGWEPTRERYIKKYQADGKDKMGKLSFNELQVETLSPTAAIVHGRFELVRGEKKDWGRFTLAFRKFPEGWKIIHDHTSVPPVEKK
jgi:ketosteroid isomerase-like protein